MFLKKKGRLVLGATGPSNVPGDAEYTYYIGLCGPFQAPDSDPHPRPSFFDITTLCGVFKVSTLRNIAVTSPYLHSGVFSTLHRVVEWYVTRDINNNTGNNPAPVPAGPDGNLAGTNAENPSSP